MHMKSLEQEIENRKQEQGLPKVIITIKPRPRTPPILPEMFPEMPKLPEPNCPIKPEHPRESTPCCPCPYNRRPYPDFRNIPICGAYRPGYSGFRIGTNIGGIENP
jgi:hypothetical protein